MTNRVEEEAVATKAQRERKTNYDEYAESEITENRPNPTCFAFTQICTVSANVRARLSKEQ